MVKNYVTLTIDEMKKAKYSLDEIEKVLSGNFFTLFNKGK